MRPGLFSGILGCLLFAACAARPPRPAVAPDEARARLLARATAPVLFDGDVSLAGRYRGQRLRARAVLRVEPGGRFYFETVGAPGLVLAADGEALTAILGDQREWLRTGADATAMEALVGLPISPEELGAVVAGAGLPPAALAGARWSADGARLVTGEAEVELDPAGAGARSGRIGRLDFHRDRDGVRFRDRSRELDLTLALRPVAASGPPPAPDLFRPSPPPGFAEVQLAGRATPVLFPARRLPEGGR